MKFSDIKIGTRMGMGYACVLALTVGIAILGIATLGHLNDKAREISKVDLPRLMQSYEAGGHLDMVAMSLRNVLLAEDEPARQDARAKIDVARRGLKDNLDYLSKTLARPAVRQKLLETDGQYAQVTDQLLSLQAQGDKKGAVDTLNKQLAPIYASYKDILTDINQYQVTNAKQDSEDMEAIYASRRTLQMLMGIAAVVIGAVCAWLVSRSIVRPLGRAVRIAGTVASGDLTQRIDVTSKDETGHLLAALRDMSNNLARAIVGIRSGAETISTASAQIAAGNTDLSSRTEEQAASLEETAASMEELASTVKQNADNARQANQLATDASEVAVRGGAVVGEVIDTMDAISASSNKISEIVSVIDGIAFQTNILALNAAVEAARAGEQGKGFAVVAGEVRTLAQRSAQAAKEIKQLIDDSTVRVTAGAQQVERAGVTMQEIVGSVKRVTDIMGEIFAATEEQARGIEQVNTAVSQMDEVTQQNAALVEEAAAASSALQDQAKELVLSVSAFKTAGVGGALAQGPSGVEPFAARSAKLLAA